MTGATENHSQGYICSIQIGESIIILLYCTAAYSGTSLGQAIVQNLFRGSCSTHFSGRDWRLAGTKTSLRVCVLAGKEEYITNDLMSMFIAALGTVLVRGGGPDLISINQNLVYRQQMTKITSR